MKDFWPIALICLGGAVLIFVIDTFLVSWLECGKLDLVPVVLRSLVFLASILILEPWTRSHIFLSFALVMAFDYFYTRMFKS